MYVKNWNIYIQELGPEMKTTKQIGNPIGYDMKPRGVLTWLYAGTLSILSAYAGVLLTEAPKLLCYVQIIVQQELHLF